MGFADFQVGRDHQDFVISQSQFIKLAMKKPKLIQKMQKFGRVRKDKPKDKNGRQSQQQ